MNTSCNSVSDSDMAPQADAQPPDLSWIAAAHPDIQVVYRYWREKCAGRRMPRRADLDPIDLAPYLPSLLLVDVLKPAHILGQPTYVYRLVGTREVAVRGVDPTGKPVAGHSFCPTGTDPLRNYDQVVKSRAPWIDRHEMVSADFTLLDRDKLFLPLSSDDDAVDMILVFTVQEKLVRSRQTL